MAEPNESSDRMSAGPDEAAYWAKAFAAAANQSPSPQETPPVPEAPSGETEGETAEGDGEVAGVATGTQFRQGPTEQP